MNIKKQIGLAIVKGVSKAFGINEAYRLFVSGADMDEGGGARPTSPYGQVSLVFTCVNKIVSSILGLPLVISDLNEKIIESGPAYDLLFNNPYLPWSRFVYETIGNYAIYRDVFWIFSNDPEKRISIVPGWRMRAVTTDGSVNGDLLEWEFRNYNGKLIPYSLDEVWHWKNFNPNYRHRGLGPASAAEQNINYTFAAELLNASALANGAELGVVVSMPGNPSDDQVRLFREHFESRQAGPAKARKTAIITGGSKLENAASSMADLEVAKLTEMSDKKICSAFEVPPGVAGLITEAQYSHGPAMRDFIFNTVIPLATLFADQITSGILNRFSSTKLLGGGFDGVDKSQARFFSGYKNLPLSVNKYFRSARTRALAVQDKAFAWFDASQHPTVMEETQNASEKMLKLADFIPVNDIVETNDLPYRPTEAGKYVWKNMGQVPADYILGAGLEGITGPPYPGNAPDESEPPPEEPPPEEEEEPGKSANREKAVSIWQRYASSWLGIEREYEVTMRKFFVDQQNQLIKKLRQAFAELNTSAFSASSAVKASPDEIIARVVFDLVVENNKIRVINQTFFMKASELGIRQVFSEVLGLSGDKLTEAAEAAKRSLWLKGKLAISSQKISGINRTTQRFVASQLRRGLEAGETVNDLAKRIGHVLGENRGRALNIARTQTAGAVGSGRHTGMKESGVDLKAWLTAGDEEVRDSHRDAGRDYANGISVDVPFIVNGEPLMYPGDPSGSAANIINCRCAEIAVRAAGKSFGMDYYEKINFLSLRDLRG